MPKDGMEHFVTGRLTKKQLAALSRIDREIEKKEKEASKRNGKKS